MPISLKKMHSFEQFAIYAALCLGSMAPENNMFFRRVLMYSQNKLHQTKLHYIIT